MIKKLSSAELELVSGLAYSIWPVVYSKMISQEQITYMLKWMYAEDTLKLAYNSGDSFFAFYVNNNAVGFLHLHPEENTLKLEKIYILPDFHSRGIGEKLISFCVKFAREKNFNEIRLQVNRENPAVNFYLHLDFVIDRKLDVDIGGGFFMNDYEMKKLIQKN